MDGEAVAAFERKPVILRNDAAPAARFTRAELGCLIDPPAATIAIHAGRGEIANPADLTQTAQRLPAACEDGIAAIIRRHGGQNMIGRGEELLSIAKRPCSVEENRIDSERSHFAPALFRATGATHRPAFREKRPRERHGAIAKTETEQAARPGIPRGHGEFTGIVASVSGPMVA